MDTITTIGLDIAKTSFAAHCAVASGKEVKKAEMKRAEVLPFFAAIAPCTVGIEACGSAHHWAREIGRLGHEVKLIPAGRVKSFVLRQKNDAADARAILARWKHNTKGAALGDWARKLLETKPFRLVAVALANKMARIAWVIMARGERFEPGHGTEPIQAAA